MDFGSSVVQKNIKGLFWIKLTIIFFFRVSWNIAKNDATQNILCGFKPFKTVFFKNTERNFKMGGHFKWNNWSASLAYQIVRRKLLILSEFYRVFPKWNTQQDGHDFVKCFGICLPPLPKKKKKSQKISFSFTDKQTLRAKKYVSTELFSGHADPKCPWRVS